ncbi:MAG: flagellar basal body P-ring formation protein FlgA [Bdellovibrionales bacterium]|nr:flagellar basal body P-ring formation protein FlgA [Bdellovibrionales bacterium]
MNLFAKFAIGFGIGLALSTFGFAAEKDDGKIDRLLRAEIGKKFPGASIELLPGSTFPAGRESLDLVAVRLLTENGTGTSDYSATYSDGSSGLGQVRFSAMVPTFVASKRVHPGDKLSRGDFSVQSVNVASGMAYQYRGVMMSAKEKLEGLQARQTILEGQYPLTSGVERIPDARRGDPIEVRIVSGDVELTTLGNVQEPAYLNQNVRILTQKSKKELVGKLKSGGVVEVRL